MAQPGVGVGVSGRLRAYLPWAAAKTTPSSEERALLRQLKEVTDRQRDELRAYNRDLLQRSQETEAVRAATGNGVGQGLFRDSPTSSILCSAHSCRSSCSASCW